MGSPALQRQLQFDLWGVTPTNLWYWNTLKDSISKCGMRNSLLTAPMHTASTSQMLGFNKCFEPYMRLVCAVIYGRFFIATFILDSMCPCRQILAFLPLASDAIKSILIAHHGSVQNIPVIPDNIKSIYKTVWEILEKKVLDVAADCGAFICQRQSLNGHFASPTMGQLMSMHFYRQKTGMYYLRTKPAAQAIQFTVNAAVLKDAKMHQAKASAEKKVNFIPSKPITVALAPPEHNFASSSSSGASTPSMSMSSISVSPSPITSTSDVSSSQPSDGTNSKML
ncbi:hypothetical protein EV359DRAFT_50525 [Lentinula novae-zelandiae]|nr:hypothetical protein EV359DRAFT_50525 [Lentinula novae-zelandiae]